MSIKALTLALAATTALAAPALAQDQVKIGVSIPAATHGWTGGLNYHANEAEKRLEALYPNLDITIVTADSPADQAGDIEDMTSVQQIDALVVLPFESDPLVEPVRQAKEAGAFITVVDRGLPDETIQDVYVAGNNTELGATSAEYFKTRLGEGDNIVILRGIPTVIDTERFDARQPVRQLEPRRRL
jgi:ribose transport system substrate-binding protein